MNMSNRKVGLRGPTKLGETTAYAIMALKAVAMIPTDVSTYTPKILCLVIGGAASKSSFVRKDSTSDCYKYPSNSPSEYVVC